MRTNNFTPGFLLFSALFVMGGAGVRGGGGNSLSTHVCQ